MYSTKDNIIDASINAQKDKCIVKNVETIQRYIDSGLMELNAGIIALSYSLKDVSIESTLETMGFLITQKEKA